VLAGEVELTGPLAVREIVEAAALAQEAERLRQEAEGRAPRSERLGVV
jgi:hypothetical protein